MSASAPLSRKPPVRFRPEAAGPLLWGTTRKCPECPAAEKIRKSNPRRPAAGCPATLGLQLDTLRAAGCAKVFEDRASGARADRPGLRAALGYAREGGVLVTWKLD